MVSHNKHCGKSDSCALYVLSQLLSLANCCTHRERTNKEKGRGECCTAKKVGGGWVERKDGSQDGSDSHPEGPFKCMEEIWRYVRHHYVQKLAQWWEPGERRQEESAQPLVGIGFLAHSEVLCAGNFLKEASHCLLLFLLLVLLHFFPLLCNFTADFSFTFFFLHPPLDGIWGVALFSTPQIRSLSLSQLKANTHAQPLAFCCWKNN